MDLQVKHFCSKCDYERPIGDFQINKQGKRMKTCCKHSKKRALPDPDIDQWDDFIYEINEWSQPGQTRRLDLSYIFDLHQLPVSLDLVSKTNGNQIENAESLNEAVTQLTKLIREAGGHRYRKSSTRKFSEITYYYRCSQDTEFAPRAKESVKRDRCQINRFACEGKLKLCFNLLDHRLKVTLAHDYHERYTDIKLSSAILAFIHTRCADKTSMEIYHELQTSGICDAEKVAQHQVSYQWHLENVSTWKRDADPFISATKLLESKKEYQHFIYTAGNVRGLGIYVRQTINLLSSRAEELAIDATYGTNSSGMDLFVVLAEFDGSGVPLCYLLVAVDGKNRTSKSADAGATTNILGQFLQPLKVANFNPHFFHCDKDKAEISAIKQIWPEVTVRLCFWHAKRAIRNKLRDNRKTMTQSHYFPLQAKAFVSRLEICWGSHSTRRPSEHKYGRCNCVSSGMLFEESGSIETSSILERDVVLEMFSRHFNMHSSIPDQNGTYRSSEQIHLDCINELYSWCHSRNYFRLWAYLFVNWYSYDQWKLWARSSCSIGIPVLKTTMIVESHWRRIKHDYLHRYNRPRIDLVVSILTSLVVPQAIDKMNAIRSKNHRKAVAAWRKTFKKNWDNLQDLSVVPQDLLKYHTNPVKWACACQGFLLSRFLVCKHIKHCFERISDRPRFFSEIQRQRKCPFWTHDQLIIRSEYRPSTETRLDSDDEPSSDSEFYESDLGNFEENTFDSSNATEQIDFRSEMNVKTSVVEILKQQESIGNSVFLKVYFEGRTDVASDKNLLEEIQRIKRQRTMPITWSRYKHPAAAFYK